MTLRAFWHQPDPRPIPPSLLARLDDCVDLTVGTEPVDDADYEVLIGVSPPDEVFAASPSLTTFLIPQAGFTASAQNVLKGHSGLAVHNLHHNAAACAETAVGLMLACAKFTCTADKDLRKGNWSTRYSAVPQMVLSGRTVVILGYGSIGRAVAPVCLALAMNVIGVRREPPSSDSATIERGVRVVGSDQLLDVLLGADVLIMALPDTPATRDLVGESELDQLPNHAIVVNVGRAQQINERALYDRLTSGQLGAAGIDVWPIEPTIEQRDLVTMPSTLAFHTLDNVVLSPHKAGWLPHDDEARHEAIAAALNAMARGEDLPNRVDISAGY